MLFGNNMSWLYGKLKKKLDAPAEAGSVGDVLTLGESGKPEWGEGGGGNPIILYETEETPAAPEGYPSADAENLYVADETSGNALTYGELSDVYTIYLSGKPVFLYLSSRSTYVQIVGAYRAETSTEICIALFTQDPEIFVQYQYNTEGGGTT